MYFLNFVFFFVSKPNMFFLIFLIFDNPKLCSSFPGFLKLLMRTIFKNTENIKNVFFWFFFKTICFQNLDSLFFYFGF